MKFDFNESISRSLYPYSLQINNSSSMLFIGEGNGTLLKYGRNNSNFTLFDTLPRHNSIIDQLVLSLDEKFLSISSYSGESLSIFNL